MAPKSFPVIVTDVPTGPEVGEIVRICGPGYQIPLLVTPFTVTVTRPFPLAAVATICVELQLVGVTFTP